MKRSKFTAEQIRSIVKEGEAGRKVADLCRTHGITEQTYYRWKAKCGGMELSEMQRLKQLEDENRRLPMLSDAAAMAVRYATRQDRDTYTLLHLSNLYPAQERLRALARLLRSLPIHVRTAHVVEVGCGSGERLGELQDFGFSPGRLCGIECRPETAAEARGGLPSAVQIITGDATHANIAPESQEIVYQSTVFSSLLTDEAQEDLARQMWAWVKPGGGILWYDFIYNNPRNPDVRGVPVSRVRALFPGRLRVQRVTLAPPLARLVPWAYPLLNLCPWLRTHVLIWIAKDPSEPWIP
jgi:transposase-like protein